MSKAKRMQYDEQLTDKISVKSLRHPVIVDMNTKHEVLG